MNTWAIVLAAGQGSRMAKASGDLPKQFLLWNGLPMYWHSVRLFAACARVRGLVLVFPQDRLEAERQRIRELGIDALGLPWRAVAGGPQRSDSVRLGLAALGESCDSVLVHDAARPFASPALVNRVLDALSPESEYAGFIPGLAVSDTIKEVLEEKDGIRPVLATPDRDRLVAVQTPQGFLLAPLQEAHQRAVQEKWTATDDAVLLERCGYRVAVLPGEAANRKMTVPEDLVMFGAPAFLPRNGWGYDVHRFAQPEEQGARPLRLGGVPIPGGLCVQAHSDGDVLLHALMDALLGCLGGGDIGQLFPDSDPALEACDSALLLDQVMEKVEEAGLRLCHVDLTLIAQVPKVAPYRESIRRNVAHLLRLDSQQVNIKATTEEGLGFTGAREGLKAVAVVSALAS